MGKYVNFVSGSSLMLAEDCRRQRFEELISNPNGLLSAIDTCVCAVGCLSANEWRSKHFIR